MNDDRKYKILLIDKDEEYTSSTVDFLKENNYEVYLCNSSSEGIILAKEIVPDFLLLDLVLDEKDGLEVCMELRNFRKLKNSYIVFLSKKSENYARIAGLNAGADDFLIKPIPNHYLLAKIRTWKKRLVSSVSSRTIENDSCGQLKVDFERFLIINNDQEIELPKKEFEIFTLLMESPQKVFTRNEIREKVWDDKQTINNRTIDVHIRKMREKLGDQIIKTIKGVGYKLDCC